MKLAFIVPSTVELLDLSGPVQVFVEAQFHGLQADIEFYSYLSEPVSTAGIGFANVRGYRDADLKEGDFLFVPGMSNDYVIGEEFKGERTFLSAPFATAHLLWVRPASWMAGSAPHTGGESKASSSGFQKQRCSPTSCT
jgi:hypothetical protein